MNGRSRPAIKFTLTKPKLLLCEGRDEAFFFAALLRHLGRSDVQIIEVGGRTNFAYQLGGVANAPDFHTVTAVLVVRDADYPSTGGGYAATWQSVTGHLAANRFPVPTAHAQYTPGPPRVAVFLMPGDGGDGMLETLCGRATRADPVTPCVDQFFDCLAADPPAVRHPVHLADKAYVHAFLATRGEPDRRLGEAAAAGDLPWADPTFAPLLDVVQRL